MKTHNLLTILMPFLIILLIFAVSIALSETKEKKVQIHTVKGSGITEEDVNGWVDKANEIDKPQVKYVVDSNHVYGPNTPYDPNKNDPCRINIWGLDTNPWAPKFPNDVDPNVSAQWGNVIILVPGDGNDIYIKDSTLAHELNHTDIPDHSDDPNNKMHPDNQYDANGVLKSCHRKDTQLTAEQRATMQLSPGSFAQDVMTNGRGGEVYDDACDVSNYFIDLHWAQLWMELIGGRYIFHMTAQVERLSLVDSSEIGFFIESDNNEATGEPPDGTDYYLAFKPQSDEIVFHVYDLVEWIPLPVPPGAVDYELTYAHPDSNLAPVPIGVKMDLDINLLIAGQTLTGNFAFKATATDYVKMDLAPNTGLLRYSYPPLPIPGDFNLDNKVNESDLQLLTEQWPVIGSFRADIYPEDGDGMVKFSDFAIMAKNWKVGIIP